MPAKNGHSKFFELPKAPTLPLAQVQPVASPTASSQVQQALASEPVFPARQAQFPTREFLQRIHHVGQFDFVNPVGFGYLAPDSALVDAAYQRARPKEPIVAGFAAHEFRHFVPIDQPNLADPKPNLSATPPVLPADGKLQTETWQVAQLELMSLLLHEQPQVYASREMPKMEELKKAKRRPLDAFEQAALKALQAGESLVVDEQSAQHVRMLGALRATRQCQNCHEVERGALLGAFSYVLTRGAATVQIADYRLLDFGEKPGELPAVRPINQLALADQALRLLANSPRSYTETAEWRSNHLKRTWIVRMQFDPPRRFLIAEKSVEIAELILNVEYGGRRLEPSAFRSADRYGRIPDPKYYEQQKAEQEHLNLLWADVLKSLEAQEKRK